VKIIAIVNQKSGVVNNTISAILLPFLPKKNLRVLVIDIDAQANLSIIFLKKNYQIILQVMIYFWEEMFNH
jgi:cellulose biosynthesis protein BcsQ